MPSLWFVVPVHGRLPLASICLKQLHRTCTALGEHGIEATAVVISTLAELRSLRKMTNGLVGTPGRSRGVFAAIARDNKSLGRRFNDGIQLALDPRYNKRPADYAVPCGSDDWVDHRLFLDLPGSHSMRAFRALSFVREDGREMTSRYLRNVAGCGIRVYHRNTMAACGFRPAEEDRQRACDTSILNGVMATARRLQILEPETDPRQIVDWKTGGQQLNPYESLRAHKPIGESVDPFVALEGVFPRESLDEMAAHYGRTGALQAA